MTPRESLIFSMIGLIVAAWAGLGILVRFRSKDALGAVTGVLFTTMVPVIGLSIVALAFEGNQAWLWIAANLVSAVLVVVAVGRIRRRATTLQVPASTPSGAPSG